MEATKSADVNFKGSSTGTRHSELKKLVRSTSSAGILLITAAAILILGSLIRSTKKPKNKN
jgi:hypothetical protein